MARPARSQPRRRFRRRPIVIGLLLVPVSVLIVLAVDDDVERWMQLRRLQSADQSQRERAMNYVYRHIGEDPALRAAVARMVNDPDTSEATVERLIAVLRAARVWGPAYGDAWLAWLAERAAAAEPTARAHVARTLGRVGLAGHPVVERPGATALVERLLADDAASVRYLALRTAATLPAAARARLLAWMVEDEQPAIAKHAWILRRLSGAAGAATTPEVGPTLYEQPLPAAQAALWAGGADAAWDVWRDRDTPPTLRAFALYVLGEDAPARARAAMLELIRNAPRSSEGEAGLLAWRAMLGVPLDAAATAALVAYYERAESVGEPADPLAAAAASRVPEALAASPTVEPGWTGRAGRALRELAWYESLPAGSTPLEIDEAMPPLMRVAAAAADADLTPDEMHAALDAEPAAVRNLACLVAVDRLDAEAVAELADRLSHHFLDHRRMAGAMLIGLRGGPVDLLEARLEREHVWVVRQHLRLAAMMLGRDEQLVDQLPALLARDDVPTSSVHLAMLHTGLIDALDRLLDPLGSAADLRQTLDQQRFAPVLRRYLPREAPPFRLHADPLLQGFQTDVLRDWYLLHRARLSFDPGTRRWTLGSP